MQPCPFVRGQEGSGLHRYLAADLAAAKGRIRWIHGIGLASCVVIEGMIRAPANGNAMLWRISRLCVSCDCHIAAAIAGDDIERRGGGSIGIDIRDHEVIDAQQFGGCIEIAFGCYVGIRCGDVPQREVIGVGEYAYI